MKPVATVVAIVVLLLTALPLAGPFTARAAAGTTQLPNPDAGPLTLRLTQMEPRLVTTDGPPTLTVVGVLTNTGRVPIGELAIRVQRGLPLGTEGAVRDALDGNAGTDEVQPQFVPVPGVLAPGAQLPVRLAVLLRGNPDSSLALGATGVYELLVNVNGTPQNAARARLAAVRILLPVLSLPPDPQGPAAASTPTAPAASPLTLLYPIADTPRRLSTVPGEPTLLADDDLAAELAPEGRLGSLVAALGAAPVGSPVRDATCLAIDPDLVETAVAMRSGYQVVTVSGPPVPGAGADVAGRWVDRLVAAARGGCVLALPFADADLVALSRGGLGPLAVTAQVEGRQLLTELLGTPVLDQAGWPVDGIADGPTLDRIADAGGRAVLLSADGIEQDRLPLRTGVLSLEDRSSPQFAVLTDPLLGVAAAGPRPSSLVSSTRGSVPTSSPAGGGSPLSTQDVIGALAFRARAGPDGSGAPVVLAPPHQWASEGSGATALLQSIDVLLETGHLTPHPLGEVLAAGPPADAPARSVSYPLRAGGREVVSAVADAVRGTDAQIADLRSAAVADSGIGLSPDAVLAPLVRGAVRPMSAAWRGRPEGALATAAADARRIAELRSTVRVLEPPSPYALGTSDAPLLVTIGNGLPFTVRVQPEIASTSGLRVAPIEMQQVPPLGRRQVQVSAQVTRSGQFTVQAAVRSPNGEPLGPPSQLRVRSTAYGTITVWLTASAGILLVVLAVRRILRRVRVEPPVHTGPIPLDPIPPSTPPGPAPPRWPTPGRGDPQLTGDPFPGPGPNQVPAPSPVGLPPTGPPAPSAPPRTPPRSPAPVESTTPLRVAGSPGRPAAPSSPNPPTPPNPGPRPADGPSAGTPPKPTR